MHDTCELVVHYIFTVNEKDVCAFDKIRFDLNEIDGEISSTPLTESLTESPDVRKHLIQQVTLHILLALLASLKNDLLDRLKCLERFLCGLHSTVPSY